MIRPAILAALALLASGPEPAAALTCLRPDVARSYAEARDAAERYVVVRGRFVPDRRIAPGRPVARETAWRGRLTGRSLGVARFDTPYDGPVTWLATCLGPWCGGPPPAGEVVAFVRLDPDGRRVIAEGPCGGGAFPADRPTVRRVLSCRRGGACAPAPPG